MSSAENKPIRDLAKAREREARLEAAAEKALDLLVGIVDGTVVIALDKTTTGWFITFAKKPS